MKKYLLLLFGYFCMSHVYGEPFKETLKLGRELTQGHPGYAVGADQTNAMKYQLEPEKQLIWQQNQQIEPRSLEQTAVANANREAIGKQLIESEKDRPRFDENIAREILEMHAKTAGDAREIIKEDGQKATLVNTVVDYVIKTCEHSRRPETFVCVRFLENPTVHVTPARYYRFWCAAGNHAPDDPRCSAKTEFNPPKKYTDKVVTVTPDSWVSECNALEARRIKSECKIIKEECVDNAPRTINGEVISKPCWKYQYTYECKYPVKNDCKLLLQQGCEPLNSKCKFKVGDKCYIWEQECRCPVRKTVDRKTVDYVKAFCLEGDCFNSEYQPNNEMLPAISQLSIFANMQQDIRTALNNIFKGKNFECRKTGWGVKDCCDLSGWGLKFKIAGCNDQEKELAEQRQKNLCHLIGTYSHGKTLGLIKKESTTFCCFPSKLTKLVHEQGKAQLGRGWGTPESPDCSGFSKEELARLDFSRMDLREAFVDIQAKPQDLARMQTRIQEKMRNIQADHTIQIKGKE